MVAMRLIGENVPATTGIISSAPLLQLSAIIGRFTSDSRAARVSPPARERFGIGAFRNRRRPADLAVGVRYHTLCVVASIAAIAAVGAGWFLTDRPIALLLTVLGAVIVWRHKSNLQRLRAGTELGSNSGKHDDRSVCVSHASGVKIGITMKNITIIGNGGWARR